MTDSPGATLQDLLRAFGWEEQRTNAKASTAAGILHVRCQELERFLAKVLRIIIGGVIYGEPI
jgi:hypothetical protein